MALHNATYIFGLSFLFFCLFGHLRLQNRATLHLSPFAIAYIMMFEVQLEVLIFKSYNKAIFMELSLI